MKFKRTIISLFAAAALSSAAVAQEPASTLLVNFHNGEVARYILSDTPVVTFEGDNLVVTSEKAQGTHARADVSHFEFKKEDIPTGIVAPGTNGADFTFVYTDNNTVTVSSASLRYVDLYTAAGVKVATAYAADGTATLDLSGVAAGVYVVSPDCHNAVKIVKK